MVVIKVFMRVSGEPLKRTPVVLRMDVDGIDLAAVNTDREGIARFDIEPASGRVFVAGIERYHGRLDGTVEISLWSITQSSNSSAGTPGAFPSGSNAYPSMSTSTLMVDGREIVTDSEGYLVNPSDWSEDFVRALAEHEGLALTAEHWEIVRYLRGHYADKGAQATVRDMIKHFRKVWDAERGSNRYLHKLFPRGGPQKQGNRLAGLLRTKGEH